MLIVRDEQMNTFEKHARVRLERKLLEGLRESDPLRLEMLGEAAAAAMIREALGNAACYGIGAPGALTRFVELTYHLGRDFDVAPEFPWAGEILTDAGLAPDSKPDVVYARARIELGASFDGRTRAAHGQS